LSHGRPDILVFCNVSIFKFWLQTLIAAGRYLWKIQNYLREDYQLFVDTTWYWFWVSENLQISREREHDTITNFVTAEVNGNIGKNSRQCGTLAFKPERWLVK
jgi:hypothetical protein